MELQKRYVIYLTDVDPDTGDVSQMKAIAYTETEEMAKLITDFLNKSDGEDDPMRKYRYQDLL